MIAQFTADLMGRFLYNRGKREGRPTNGLNTLPSRARGSRVIVCLRRQTLYRKASFAPLV